MIVLNIINHKGVFDIQPTMLQQNEASPIIYRIYNTEELPNNANHKNAEDQKKRYLYNIVPT